MKFYLKLIGYGSLGLFCFLQGSVISTLLIKHNILTGLAFPMLFFNWFAAFTMIGKMGDAINEVEEK